MKSTLHPTKSDFKRAEVFDGSINPAGHETVGIRFVTGQAVERFSEAEWTDIIADVRERFALKRARAADPRR